MGIAIASLLQNLLIELPYSSLRQNTCLVRTELALRVDVTDPLMPSLIPVAVSAPSEQPQSVFLSVAYYSLSRL